MNEATPVRRKIACLGRATIGSLLSLLAVAAISFGMVFGGASSARADIEITTSWGGVVDHDDDGFPSSFTLNISLWSQTGFQGNISLYKTGSSGSAGLVWSTLVSLPAGTEQYLSLGLTGGPHGLYDYEIRPFPGGGIGIPPMPDEGLQNHPEETPAEDVIQATHPADVDQNWRIEMSEAIGYAYGWQQGINPLANAIRALYIWQSGPCYHCESGVPEPMCWVPDNP